MKVVVSNVFGPLNLGDFELFKKLIDIVNKEDVEISAIARDPELSAEHFSDINFHEQIGKSNRVVFRFIYLFFSFFYLISPRVAKYFLPESQYSALQSLKESDIVIACPGGFLEDSSFSFYVHLIQLYLATRLSKKVVLAPMSIGPARSAINKIFLKLVLRNVDKIYVRELVSADLCNSLNIDFTLSNDLAFDLKPRRSVSREDLALFTIINWNFPTSTDSSAQLDNYISSLVEAASYIHKSYGMSIGVIQQVASDRPAIDRFVYQLEKLDIPVVIEGEGYTPEEIMELISVAKIVVASRFHSAIFSLNVGTPVIPISYLPKTTGMLNLYGCHDLYLDIVDLESKKLLSYIDRLIHDESYYNQSLARINELLNDYKRFENECFSCWS